MTLTAILLILVSACTHVAWNTLGKRRHPNLAFFTIACAFGALYLLPALLWNHELRAYMPVEVGLLLVLSGLFQALYIGSLGFAYKHGHLSVAYPLARALPVLFVSVLSAMRSDTPPGLALYTGGALIIAGAVLLPLPGFRAWDWHHYRNLSCLFALTAALGTAGYSVTDDHALRLFRNATAEVSPALNATLCYMCFESIATVLWLLPALLLQKQSRRDAAVLIRGHLRTTALTGFFMAGGYALILVSMAHVRDISYVVAFRQASIPFGALAGIVFLREPAHAPKIVGVALLFVGLVLTALG